MFNFGPSQSVIATQPEVSYFLKRAFYRVICLIALRKTPNFYIIFWCGYILETHSFRRVSSDSPEALRKLCVSIKFPHQEIRSNFGVLCIVSLKPNVVLWNLGFGPKEPLIKASKNSQFQEVKGGDKQTMSGAFVPSF